MTPIRHPQRQTFSRMFALQTITRDPAAPAASETTEAAALSPLPRVLDGVAFRRAVHRQGSRRLRTEEPLKLPLPGIDDFAAIERQHGAAVGERAVATTSRQLHDVLRASDLLACWARERFAVLTSVAALPQAPPTSCFVRLRTRSCGPARSG
jgi:GGDEF domain-containing protein